MMRPEINKNIVILLKFKTTDEQEIPVPDYAAVPSERLRKLEKLAILARELIAANNANITDGVSHMAQKAISDLTTEVSALEKIWNFKGSNLAEVADGAVSNPSVADSDEARIDAGH